MKWKFDSVSFRIGIPKSIFLLEVFFFSFFASSFLRANSDTARAAEISIAETYTLRVPVIAIRGDLDADDDEQFFRITNKIPAAIVALESNGGVLDTGLEIGRQIRRKGFWTVVQANKFCTSACALAWLGGSRRFIEHNGQVGFHAAYVVDDGTPVEKGTANASVGAYIVSLGLQDVVARYVTSAAPHEIKWLTKRDAISHGINVVFGEPSPDKPSPIKQGKTALPRPKPEGY